MPFNSIRARMTAGLTLFIALLSLVSGCGLWLRSRHDAFERDRMRLANTVTLVRAELRKGSEWESIAQSVRDQNLTDQEGDVELWRLGANGREVRHMGGQFPPHEASPPPQAAPSPPENALLPQGADPQNPPPPPERGGRRFRGGAFVPPRDDPRGWISARLPMGTDTVIVAVPWHKSQRGLDNQAFALLMLGTFLTLATAAGAWVLVGRTLLPIEKLAAQARQQALQQTGHEPTAMRLRAPSSDGEVRELVATFNALLDNVARTARVREQFHTSASHELRTPLQALSGTLQLALSRPRSNEEYLAALMDARTQSERLNALTRDLLVLNQLGTDNEVSNREEVSLAEACDLALSGLERLLAAKNIQLKEALEPIEVIAPPSHVEMLTRNLLENAVKYSPQEGIVRVSLKKTDPQLCIWNAVTTALVSSESGRDESLSEWFEPFYRPDQARASKTGGNGLGLAICKAICDANEWNIELVRRDGGIEARVRFGN